MATWKDGPEYAPTHRPDGFATPEVEPLDAAPPAEPITPGAIPPPSQFQDVQVPPLTQVGHDAAPSRSPQQPFDVASASLTSAATLPDGNRDPRAPFNVAASSMTAQAPSQLPPPPPDAKPLSQGPTPPAPTQPPPPASAVRHGQPPAQRPQPPTQHAQPPAPQQTYQPARQWQPETGQWQPPNQLQKPPDAARPLVHLVTGMAFVGMLLPSAAPILLTIAGTIASARVPKLREIGFFTSALGGVFLLVQFLIRDSGLEPIYALAAFGATAAFLIRGYLQNRR